MPTPKPPPAPLTPDRSSTRQQPSPKNSPSKSKSKSKSASLSKWFRSVCKSFPIINPTCRMPISLHGNRFNDNHIHGGKRMTGTLFGTRKSRVNLVIQENPKCLPMLVLELSIPTEKLLQDIGSGLVRIALECEKNSSDKKTKLMDELLWTMYCNGRKTGYGVKREPTDDDLNVVQTLHAVSMGAGVLPTETAMGSPSPDGELTYMRAYFDRAVGSKDSETYYMMNPDGNSGPELSIFFVRI